ncbi:MAG: bacillithiol system redox-active protein YtxJ [Acidobacteriota bacterium]|nr:bacillithiol system redox-active protein YtxJ [Acidobacteriota bacterium]
METQFITVDDASALNEWMERSRRGPVVLFKHSTACPISSAAYREMERVGAEVGLVVVQRARSVSREVAERTGVRHESPQVFVLRDGAVVWTASHYDVTADAVKQAVSEHQGSAEADN